jgi:hypothetical protein
VPTGLWAIGITGFFRRDIGWPDRIFLMICGVVAIVAPTGALLWWLGNGAGVAFLVLNSRYAAFSFGSLMPGAASRRARSAESAP